jgi:hypothetical protein
MWEQTMQTFAQQSKKPQKYKQYTNFAYEILLQSHTQAGHLIAVSQDDENGRVLVRRDDAPGTGHIVDLDKKTCTCLQFQDWQLPYAHAWRAISFLKETPHFYITNFWTLRSYRAAYLNRLEPVLIRDLKPDGTTKYVFPTLLSRLALTL